MGFQILLDFFSKYKHILHGSTIYFLSNSYMYTHTSVGHVPGVKHQILALQSTKTCQCFLTTPNGNHHRGWQQSTQPDVHSLQREQILHSSYFHHSSESNIPPANILLLLPCFIVFTVVDQQRVCSYTYKVCLCLFMI